ncbi:hypothetical protein MMC24_005389 [Lignoscripta atroalba]|nr:hypothetical protein [Lignoscripta atroalba]
MDSSAEVSSKPFRFPDLPSEVRNQIYEILFVKKESYRGGIIVPKRNYDCPNVIAIESLLWYRNSWHRSAYTDPTIKYDEWEPEIDEWAPYESDSEESELDESESADWELGESGPEDDESVELNHKEEGQYTSYHLRCDIPVDLFFVCRQIYDEASHIFYSRNEFYAESLLALVAFLKDLSTQARSSIRLLSMPFVNGTTTPEGAEPIYQDTATQWYIACYCLSHSESCLPNLRRLDLRFTDMFAGYKYPEAGKIIYNHLGALALAVSPKITTISGAGWYEWCPENKARGKSYLTKRRPLEGMWFLLLERDGRPFALGQS